MAADYTLGRPPQAQFVLDAVRVPADLDGTPAVPAAIAIDDGKIAWVGAPSDLPLEFRAVPRKSLGGRLVTPALIDCHTHIVHGGNRSREFALRLQGASYEEIARQGGGIVSTVSATRSCSEAELVRDAGPRVRALVAEGVGTLEIKSGYGLDRDTELAMLRAARALGPACNVRVLTTFLGAHAVPSDYAGQADAYIDEVCIPTLQAAASEGLVDAVDGFCEGIAFTPAQIGRVFTVARDLGIPVKLHSDQLSNIGGTRLAASYGALSVDHLEHTGPADVDVMARAGSVAVLLPGAFYFLRETQLPPVGQLRARGVPMAVATDCNPGSSPLTSLLLAMNMACTLFRLTPHEALLGVTRHAARALGLTNIGVLAPGFRAELAVWDVEDVAELSYRVGFNPLYCRVLPEATDVG